MAVKSASNGVETDYTLLINSVLDTELIMLDKDGLVQTWNTGAEILNGYKAIEVVGKPVTLFYTKEDAKNGLAERELRTALQTGRFEGEGWRVKKGGEKFWAGVAIATITDSNGVHKGFVKIARDLTERIEREGLLQKQRDEINALSTPVIQVWAKVLVLPVIGTLDSQRAARLTENLLTAISAKEAEFVIVDISGVPSIDTQVAHHLLKTIQAARLMGARTILSGVRPETAQAMVHLGIEFASIQSRATLRDALQLALRLMGATTNDIADAGKRNANAGVAGIMTEAP
ncbi:MAG: PAS domain S-box protein [Candidatus Thermoplasmatota archaeon]